MISLPVLTWVDILSHMSGRDDSVERRLNDVFT